MTTLVLDKIYKNIPMPLNMPLKISILTLKIKNLSYSLDLQVVGNRQLYGWLLDLKILPKVNLKLMVRS